MKVVLTMLSLPGDRWRQFNNNKNDDRIWEEVSRTSKSILEGPRSGTKDHPRWLVIIL